MNYIVLDLEWNQQYATKNRRPRFKSGEIIQIGAIKLDNELSYISKFKSAVRPRYMKKIHRHVQRITGISQETIQHGYTLNKALELFKEWCGDDDFVFITWGPDDEGVLRENMEIYGIDKGWLPEFINYQLAYGIKTAHLAHQISLGTAVSELNIDEDIKFHDALNDAYYTAKVVQKLHYSNEFLQNSLKPQTDIDGAIINPSNASQTFEFTLPKNSRFEVTPELLNSRCPYCGEKLHMLDWYAFSGNNKYISIGRCPAHNDIYVSIIFYRESNYVLVRKSLKYANNEQVDKYNSLIYERDNPTDNECVLEVR